MSELAMTNDALNAVREALANDLASVGAAITEALADVDAQLTTLHARREDLESALDAVVEQIAATDAHRSGLTAALEQIAADRRAGAATAGPSAPVASAAAVEPAAPVDMASEHVDDGEWVEFDEASLSTDRPRTERIIAVLEQSQQALPSADIAGVLNAYGDTTTTKVVSGTLSNLVNRGSVVKVEQGLYALPQ